MCHPVKVSLLVFILYFVKNGESILCYDCNSAFDPRCGDEFDPFSLGIVNCSLREPLDHLPDLEAHVCRTIKMEMSGKVRVVRQCGYITDEAADDQPCVRRTNTDTLFITYCSCTTDLCNNAGPLASEYAAGFAASLAILCCLISYF